VDEAIPRASLAVPVRNGEAFLRRCLDSALAQEFEDFEVVVSDNASDDRTPEILAEYAARDPRVRVFSNESDIGLIENVNRVFHLSRGGYFRWLGADDWIEPGYLARCVAALDAHPEAVGVTTGFRAHLDSGESRWEDYRGEVADAPDPARRLGRMLWFFHASDLYYDPVYSLFRREALARTQLIRVMTCADMMLACELCLQGPLVHLPEPLSHRRRAYQEFEDRTWLMKRYHPTRWRQVSAGPFRIGGVLLSILASADLDASVRLRSLWPIGVFTFKQARRHYLRSLTNLRRRLGITRENVPFLRASGD
jgi:glycosyltransferase involved in cell wall biosynthesis